MLRNRHAVNQAPRLDRSLFRIGLPTDSDAVVLRPLGRLLRVRPDDLGEAGLQGLVTLELTLYLSEEGFGNRPSMTKDADSDFRVA